MRPVARLLTAPTIVLGLLSANPSPAQVTQDNFWEWGLTKTADDSYGIQSEGFNKIGATGCMLQTPGGPSDCISLGDGFFLPKQFFDERNGLSFEQLFTEIDSAWTLTWDDGTIATIDFLTGRGDITPDAWPSTFPMITNPVDGALTVSPDTTIDWNYGAVPPPDPNGMFAFLWGPNDDHRLIDLSEDIASGKCMTATSCKPDPSLTPGDWIATVNNRSDIRFVVAGVGEGIQVTGGTWSLDQSSWLTLDSIDQSEFTVVPEPSTALLIASGLVALAASRRRFH